MSSASPGDRSPRPVRAVVRRDATAEVVVGGVRRSLAADDVDEARRAVRAIVAEHARQTGAPVLLRATDPLGRWDLLVQPDGAVTEAPDPEAPAGQARQPDVPEPAGVPDDPRLPDAVPPGRDPAGPTTPERPDEASATTAPGQPTDDPDLVADTGDPVSTAPATSRPPAREHRLVPWLVAGAVNVLVIGVVLTLDRTPAGPVAGVQSVDTATATVTETTPATLPEIALDPVVDGGAEVELAWAGPSGWTYVLLYSTDGGAPVAQYLGESTQVSVVVDAAAGYCFQLVGYDGATAVPSRTQTVRDGSCPFGEPEATPATGATSAP